MQSRSYNIKFTSYNAANQVVDELFESLRSRYQENLEASMRGSDFLFESVQVMYYKCHKVNSSGSYIGSPDWIYKNKKSKNKSKKLR